MKTGNNKSAYKLIIYCGIFLFSHTIIAKDITFSKKYEWNYDVNADVKVLLKNYDCDVIIETSSTNKVRFAIQIDVESKDDEEINTLKNYLESLSFSANENMVSLETTFWENLNSNNSVGRKVIKMKLKNGESVKLSEFKIKASLQIPATTLLELSSKYSKIEMENVQNLKLDSYDDKIYGKSVVNEVDLSAKYSKLEFESFGPTIIDIYDCNFTAEKTADLTIKSKYSDINIGQTGNIKIEGYDDNLTFKNTGDIELQTKYSKIISNITGNLNVDIYDSDFEIEEIGNLTISASKYSGYNFKSVKEVKIATSYDDNFNFGSLTLFKTDHSKYSDFTISNLHTSFEIVDGYDDNVKISNTSGSFKFLSVNSKYGDIDLTTPDSLPLKIDWKTKYGKLNFDESKLTTRIKIKENSDFEYQGIKGVEKENMPYIIIRGYDIKMNLNN